jgi:hypothetical protein
MMLVVLVFGEKKLDLPIVADSGAVDIVSDSGLSAADEVY